MTRKSRIVLADDHPIVLNGLRNLIQAERDFELVGEASNGLAALKVIREQQPDVAVIDISMPELNGICGGSPPGGRNAIGEASRAHVA